MEILNQCNLDMHVLHSLEKQLFLLLVTTSVLTTVTIAAAVATCCSGLRNTTEQHPILQTPIAECSNEKAGSLVTHNSFSVTVTPVQQTSTDKGEQVISV